jgi:hypothetical protein
MRRMFKPICFSLGPRGIRGMLDDLAVDEESDGVRDSWAGADHA